MRDDEALKKANDAILNARRVINEAEAALRHVAELQRERGITPDAIQEFLNCHLSPAQRMEIDSAVEKSLAMIRAEAEIAVSSQQQNTLRPRIQKIRNHI